MTCAIDVADFTTVARIINLAHRFQCVTTRVDSATRDGRTHAAFEIDGDPKQLDRLKAQIDRITQFESIFVTP